MSQPEEPAKLPDGYHSGLLTAITVFLGFSLAFFRFWTVDPASGPWTRRGIVSASVMGVGILVQLVAFFKALSLKDQEPQHYQSTVRWFQIGVVIVIAGFLIAIYLVT